MWLLKVYLAGTFSLVVGACRRVYGTPKRIHGESVGAWGMGALVGKDLNYLTLVSMRPRDVDKVGVVRWI